MHDGIVATIQTPFAGAGFDSNRSGIGIRQSVHGQMENPLSETANIQGE
jgi:hypothetical protein